MSYMCWRRVFFQSISYTNKVCIKKSNVSYFVAQCFQKLSEKQMKNVSTSILIKTAAVQTIHTNERENRYYSRDRTANGFDSLVTSLK